MEISISSVASEELEAAMLGRLINDKYVPMQVLPLLNMDCFNAPVHRTLYKAIVELDLAGHEISMTSVTEQMRNTLSAQRAAELVAQTVTTVFNNDELIEPEYMALRLLEYAKRRKLGEVSQKIMRLNTDMTYPLAQGISEVQDLFDRIVMGHQESFVALKDSLKMLDKIIEDNLNEATRHTGLLCNLPPIDEQGGLPADGLVVIGAKASHGKTTVATNVAMAALKAGKKIAFYSMEMSMEKVTGRILSMECGIPANVLLRQRLSLFERERVHKCIEELQSSVASQFFFDNRQIRDLNALVLSIRALKKTRGVDCIVVDYLQLMNDSPGQHSENTNKLLGGIAHRLHEVAQDLHVTILLLSQINRTVMGEPNMAHLRDSGEIAEAADMVIIVYNADFEHNTFSKPFDNVKPHGKLLVKVEKNRDGATQSFLVGFSPGATRIFPLSEDDTKEVPVENDIFENL